MKATVVFFFAALLMCLPEVSAHNYKEGQHLTVFAHSGLRLRMSPSKSAKTLKIVPFGSQVMVINTFGFDSGHKGKMGWLDGHWILVSYNGVEGYVFDMFLSKFEAPDHEDQLCIDCPHLIFPFETYVMEKFPAVRSEQGPDHTEFVEQFISYADSNVHIIRTSGEKWYNVEMVFANSRMCEVLNIFRALLVGQNERNDFEESLLFRKNEAGIINSIEVRMYDPPIHLDLLEDGTIHVESTIFLEEDGC